MSDGRGVNRDDGQQAIELPQDVRLPGTARGAIEQSGLGHERHPQCRASGQIIDAVRDRCRPVLDEINQ